MKPEGYIKRRVISSIYIRLSKKSIDQFPSSFVNVYQNIYKTDANNETSSMLIKSFLQSAKAIPMIF